MYRQQTPSNQTEIMRRNSYLNVTTSCYLAMAPTIDTVLVVSLNEIIPQKTS